MKKIILLIVMFVGSMNTDNVFSQDIIDPSILPNINFNDTLIIDRNYQQFIRGSNWFTAGRQLDSALYLNSLHYGNFAGSNQFHINPAMIKNNHRLMYKELWLSWGVSSDHELQVMSLYLEPTLNIDSTDNFNPKFMDNTGAVFGFLYKNSTFLQDSVSYPNSNYHRLILKKSRLNGADSAIVLDNSWPNNQLYFINGVSPDKNGQRWDLSINLRSLERIDTVDDSPVLTIRIPYESTSLSGKKLIKFYFTPNPSSIVSIFGRDSNDFRGYAMGLDSNRNADSTKFVITRRMLAAIQNIDTSQNITISALFYTQNDSVYYKIGDSILGRWCENRRLRQIYYWNDDTVNNHFIRNMEVQVAYNGRVNCAIDFIKFETPYAQSMFRGKRDSTIGWYINNSLNTVRDINTPINRGIKLHRFYAADEFLLPNWASMRYFNKLVDGLAISETPIIYAPLYMYSLNFSRIYYGDTPGLIDAQTVPFLRNTIRDGVNPFDFRTFGYHNGYYGLKMSDTNALQVHLKDTINSLYETYIRNPNAQENEDKYLQLPVQQDTNIYDARYSYGTSPQLGYEKHLKERYFDRTKLLFSPTTWYANVWVAADNWMGISRTWTKILSNRGAYGRVKTGEEFRLISNISIITGAKGLMYWTNVDIKNDADTTNFIFGSTSIGNKTLLNIINSDTNLRTSKKLIYSDSVGNDFITYPDPTGCHSFVNNNLSDTNHIRYDLLNHDSTRIYLGRKSTRAEIYKQSKYLDIVGDTLLNLRLTSMYSKGYRTHEKTSPGFASGIFHNFIELDSIKTKKLNRLDSTGNFIYDTKPYQFFDMTLLRSNYDPIMAHTAWFGLLNRRTDPLIHDSTLNNGAMTFITTAEFDKFVHENGHMGHDSAYWQSKYWSKQGAREFFIPLKFPKSSPDSLPASVWIEELGAESIDLSREDWRDPKYYHLIDTLLNGTDTLRVRLMPGDMKILKANYYYTRTINDTSSHCSICNSIDSLKVIITQTVSDSTHCCWDIKLVYNDSCSFQNVMMWMGTENSNFDLSFNKTTDSNFFVYNPRQYGNDLLIPINFNKLSKDTFSLGSICTPIGNAFDFKFHILGTELNQTCSKDTTVALGCPADTLPCCDSLKIIQTRNFNYECCFDITFEPYRNCADSLVYGMDVLSTQCINGKMVYVLDNNLTVPYNSDGFKLNTYNRLFCFGGPTSCGNMQVDSQCYKFIIYDKWHNPVCNKELCQTYCYTTHIINHESVIPNPASNIAVIHYETTTDANIKIDIYTASGLLIENIKNVHEPMGIYDVLYDTGNLINGTYNVVISANNTEFHTVPFTILR